MAKKAAKKAARKHEETWWAVQIGNRPSSSPYFMLVDGKTPMRAALFASREEADLACIMDYHKPVRVRVSVI
jgi:hypothetical protein